MKNFFDKPLRRLGALALCLAMVLSLLPATASANFTAGSWICMTSSFARMFCVQYTSSDTSTTITKRALQELGTNNEYKFGTKTAVTLPTGSNNYIVYYVVPDKGYILVALHSNTSANADNFSAVSDFAKDYSAYPFASTLVSEISSDSTLSALEKNGQHVAAMFGQSGSFAKTFSASETWLQWTPILARTALKNTSVTITSDAAGKTAATDLQAGQTIYFQVKTQPYISWDSLQDFPYTTNKGTYNSINDMVKFKGATISKLTLSKNGGTSTDVTSAYSKYLTSTALDSNGYYTFTIPYTVTEADSGATLSLAANIDMSAVSNEFTSSTSTSTVTQSASASVKIPEIQVENTVTLHVTNPLDPTKDLATYTYTIDQDNYSVPTEASSYTESTSTKTNVALSMTPSLQSYSGVSGYPTDAANAAEADKIKYYGFVGWSTTATGSKVDLSTLTGQSSDVDLYTVWHKGVTLTYYLLNPAAEVSLNGNNLTPNSSDLLKAYEQVVQYGTSTTEWADSPTTTQTVGDWIEAGDSDVANKGGEWDTAYRKGLADSVELNDDLDYDMYTFVAWNTQYGTPFSFGDSGTKLTQDTSIYSVWGDASAHRVILYLENSTWDGSTSDPLFLPLNKSGDPNDEGYVSLMLVLQAMIEKYKAETGQDDWSPVPADGYATDGTISYLIPSSTNENFKYDGKQLTAAQIGNNKDDLVAYFNKQTNGNGEEYYNKVIDQFQTLDVSFSTLRDGGSEYTYIPDAIDTIVIKYSPYPTITYENAVNTKTSEAGPDSSTISGFPDTQNITSTTTQTITAAAPTTTSTINRNGVKGTWSFKGWTQKGTSTVYQANAEYTLTQPLTLVATWEFEAADVTVGYKLEADDEAPEGATMTASATVKAGSTQNAPANLTSDCDHNADGVKGSWTFDGWTTENINVAAELANGGTTYTVPNDGVTFTGSWTFTPASVPIKYEVTGDAPATHSGIPATVNGRAGSTATLADNITTESTDNNGTAGVWTFSGWTTADSTVTTELKTHALYTVPNDGVTFTGSWTFSSKIVKIKYQFADGPQPTDVADKLPSEETVGAGATVEVAYDVLTDETRYGTVNGTWVFSGWVADDDAVNTALESGNTFTVPNDDLTFTGTWTFKPEIVTIGYKLDEDGDQPKTIENLDSIPGDKVLEDGSTDTVAEPLTTTETTKDGVSGVWTFQWVADNDDVNEALKNGDTYTVPNGGVTFTGVWTFTANRTYSGISTQGSGVSNWLDNADHSLYLVGYEDGSFGPDKDMTRAEVAVMFYRLLKDKDVAITVTFPDVAEDTWYATAVNTLASLKIIDGYTDGTFRPNDPITRAEFTTIGMRFAYPTNGGENKFSDVAKGEWYYDYIVGATNYGWISGYADGTFRPDANIKRSEVATIVNAMLDREADKEYVEENIGDVKEFADVPKKYWAYSDIVEATNSHTYSKTEETSPESWNSIG